jgi:hypothetical protein
LFFGKKSIQLPSFTTFLGLFTTKPFKESDISSFIQTIPNEYQLVNITLDKLNIDKFSSSNSFISYENAFELDIIRSYHLLQNQFETDLKEKISNSEKTKVNIVSGIQLIDLLQLHIANSELSSLKLKDNQIKQLRNLGLNSFRYGSGELIGAYDSKNTLCAASLFVSSHNKAHLIFYAQNKMAVKFNILDQIIDFFIRKHSEKNITLSLFNNTCKHIDFRSFGAIPIKYPKLQYNRLPIYLKPLKKIFSS